MPQHGAHRAHARGQRGKCPRSLRCFLLIGVKLKILSAAAASFFFLGLLSAKGKENYWQKQEGPGRLSFLQEHIFSVFTV